MRFTEGRRVKLVADLRLAGEATLAVDAPDSPAAGASAGFLALPSGTEGTVERVDAHEREQSHGAREYERLTSLLGDFGHQMPPASRQQLEDRIGELEAEWRAFQERKDRVTVRVRFDNGFVLDGADQEAFAAV
ncbi:hypothetical protein ACWCQL_16825 [Streptomyces sp. NPDC002073]